jgi:copper chaperone CopZ
MEGIMKKTFALEDLDCANCALKVENGVKKLEGVKSCSVSFMTQKMTIETEDGVDLDELMKRVVKLCRKVEPDMRIKL